MSEKLAGSGGVARRIALGALAAIALILLLAQLFLPGIAAGRLRTRVGKYGTVQSVTVTAWPAVDLLWGEVGSVTVRAANLRISPRQTAQLLWEARGVNTLSLIVANLNEGSLRLREASFQKHGRALVAKASAVQANVQAALGKGSQMQLVTSAHGQVEVRVTGGLFGVNASFDAAVRAQEGKLVVQPLSGLEQGLQLTLFSDPHVFVEGVGAIAMPGPGGMRAYMLTMNASLR